MDSSAAPEVCSSSLVALVAIRKLLQKHWGLKEASYFKAFPLHDAAGSGDMEKVRNLMTTGDAACTDSIEWTPLHYASAVGHLDMVSMLISEFMVDASVQDIDGRTPIMLAALAGHSNIVCAMLSMCQHGVGTLDAKGNALIHYACAGGNVSIIEVLIRDHGCIIDTQNDDGNRPIHLALLHDKEEMALALLSEFGCDANVKGAKGWSLMHIACFKGNVSLVQTLLHEHKADKNIKNDQSNTPLHIAALNGKEEIALSLISEYGCDTTIKGYNGWSLLHCACQGGNINLVQILIEKYQADINAINHQNNTPLHVAALKGQEEVALFLINEFACTVSVTGYDGWSLLHSACEGGSLRIVCALIQKHKVDINAKNSSGIVPLHIAASNSKEKVALALINDFDCDISIKDNDGWSSLHHACQGNSIGLVRVLMQRSLDVSAKNNQNNTPLHVAALKGREEIAKELIEKFGGRISIKGSSGWSLLHCACQGGSIGLVRYLIKKHKVNINARNCQNNTPFHIAALNGNEEVALGLINEFKSNISIEGFNGRSSLHSACKGGGLRVVHSLIQENGMSVEKRDSYNQLPIHDAALHGRKEVVLLLISKYGCETNDIGFNGNSVLHCACQRGSLSLVRILIQKLSADVEAKNNFNRTPLHIAALHGQEEVALALIKDFKSDISIKDSNGWSLLHCACQGGCVNIVQTLIELNLEVDAKANDGNTPLHIAASCGRDGVVSALICYYNKTFGDNSEKSLLHIIFLRNNDGKTPFEVATAECQLILHMTQNSIYETNYDSIQGYAIKEDGDAEHVIRVFVIGHCGVGKSSLIETLKRDKIYDRFRRISESTVPPHTAGIIPVLFQSKICGKLLFYDFAGDAEYYSSHAAILENLTSSQKSDNIFMIVVDLRESDEKIKTALHYWVSFIKHQKLKEKSPFIIYIGSHVDQTFGSDKGQKFKELCEDVQPKEFVNFSYFMVDCCQPKTRQIEEIKNRIVGLTKCSPKIKLTHKASLLLDFLKKKFTQTSACSLQDLVCHLKATLVNEYIHLPKTSHQLRPLLTELHDLGFLLMIEKASKGEDVQVVLNPAQLTSKVHQSLFSSKEKQRLRERHKTEASLNIGVISKNVLTEILPQGITTDCLVLLQYCQEISKPENDQTLYFFPALISSSKTEALACVSPFDFTYSIGWLIQCIGPDDFFPPRFLHVLLIRLAFRVSVSDVACGVSDLRHCTMWKAGVHWKMEEGVECMVELVNRSKGVVIIAKSKELEKCKAIFSKILSCVMEARAEFCPNVKPQLLILKSIDEKEYFNEDNQFSLCAVGRVLAHSELKTMINSVSGKNQMDSHQLFCLKKLIHWYNYFPLDYTFVLQKIDQKIESLIQSNGSVPSLYNIRIVPYDWLQHHVLPNYATKRDLIELQYCQEISVGIHSRPSTETVLFFPALLSMESDPSWKTASPFSLGVLAHSTQCLSQNFPRIMLRLAFSFTVAQSPAANPESSNLPFPHNYESDCSMWERGIYWIMKESGIECMVELVDGNSVVVTTKCEQDMEEECVHAFSEVVRCVVGVISNVQSTSKFQFYFLDSTEDSELLNPSNHFTVSDVEKLLATRKGQKVLVSQTGTKKMKPEKLVVLFKLAHWYNFFPLNRFTVLKYLEDVVGELTNLGLHLDLRPSILEAIEVDFPSSVERRRREVVKRWMSSTHTPPCWWHLTKALREIGMGALAAEIEKDHGRHIKLQEKLLTEAYKSRQPDPEFLKLLASVVGISWSSLAMSLSVEESKSGQEEEGLSSQDRACRMLNNWAAREDSTYHSLYTSLMTVSILYPSSEQSACGVQLNF